MKKQIFITGIGTGIGKTFVSTLLIKSLNARYWKPIQAGTENTDTDFIKKNCGNEICYPEIYKLKNPESAHSAARKQKINININHIKNKYEDILKQQDKKNFLFIEGVGGTYSPINDELQNIDIIKTLNLEVILISKNYLGSLNHSLMLAEVLKFHKIKTVGWIFINYNLQYEKDLVKWSGIKKLFSINNLTEEDLNKKLTVFKTIKKVFN